MEDWKSPPILKEPTPDTSTLTLSDSDDITDEMLTYWFGANVYVCEFPVVRSVTVMVTLFGDKFSKYISNGGEELVDVVEEDGDDDEDDEGGLELCELDDGVELELLLCEPVEEDVACSICWGVIGWSPKPASLKYSVWTEDCKSTCPIVMLKLGITISTSSDSDDITDEMLTYWFGANVYVCEFPVVRSTTLKTRVLG